MQLAAETRVPPAEDPLTEGKSGSDFMVDVLKSLNIEYAFACPGSAFRGIHESIINYGGNSQPELITCLHEEASVHMAQGYAKIEGRPAVALIHAVVGVQHASMAVYNAWCDRAPVYILIGNLLDAAMRRPGADWVHAAQDNAAMLRDCLKWDDQPVSLPHFAESALRAYQLATTPPTGPVALAIDAELQENPISAGDAAALSIPKLPRTTAVQGDSGAVEETAKLLVAADYPVLVADRMARTQAGIDRLKELAELIQAPVVDEAGRMNFPSRHPLNLSSRPSAPIRQADVILGLELSGPDWGFWGTVNRMNDNIVRRSHPITKPGVKTVHISALDLDLRSNYQEFGRFADVDLAISGDSEETLPSLIEAVRRNLTDDRRVAIETRGKKVADQQAKMLQADRDEAAANWDSSPVSTARLCAELWDQIRGEDWSFVSEMLGISNWPQRLWAMEKQYHYIGNWGGGGIGYGSGAAVGAALANRAHGRLTVAINPDGDLMFSPGTLWTAAHHRIPLLMLVFNNRGYHQEYMHIERMAARHGRGLDRAWIGTEMRDPHIDYAKIAQGFGVYAQGPISDPKDLGQAIKRAIDVVKHGEPALIDVVSQPR
jgi:acetolactate synthase I/II/III large subunit